MRLPLYSQERNGQALFSAIQTLVLCQYLLSILRARSRCVDAFGLSSTHAFRRHLYPNHPPFTPHPSPLGTHRLYDPGRERTSPRSSQAPGTTAQNPH